MEILQQKSASNKKITIQAKSNNCNSKKQTKKISAHIDQYNDSISRTEKEIKKT